MAPLRRAGVLPWPLTSGAVLALWLPYAALNLWFPGPGPTHGLGLLVAGAALALARLGGLTRTDCFLCLAPPSRAGLWVLLVLACFIPLALLAGRGQPWAWQAALVDAPTSALGQELYFRAALLPVLLRLTRGRARPAIVIQAALFALWHARAFRVVGVAPALGVLVLLFGGGVLWGWQVWRDRTLAYAALQHTLFLIVQ